MEIHNDEIAFVTELVLWKLVHQAIVVGAVIMMAMGDRDDMRDVESTRAGHTTQAHVNE